MPFWQKLLEYLQGALETGFAPCLQGSIKYNFPMLKPRLIYRLHAVQRMFERKISGKNVRQALEAGDVIEDYSDEMPEPGRLILGFHGKHPFHVVASENAKNEFTVVTVYVPDADKWKKDFRSRK